MMSRIERNHDSLRRVQEHLNRYIDNELAPPWRSEFPALFKSLTSLQRFASVNQFIPCQCVSHCCFDLGDAAFCEGGDSFDEVGFRYRPEIVAIYYARLPHAFRLPQANFDRNSADCGCNLRHDEFV